MKHASEENYSVEAKIFPAMGPDHIGICGNSTPRHPSWVLDPSNVTTERATGSRYAVLHSRRYPLNNMWIDQHQQASEIVRRNVVEERVEELVEPSRRVKEGHVVARIEPPDVVPGVDMRRPWPEGSILTLFSYRWPISKDMVRNGRWRFTECQRHS